MEKCRSRVSFARRFVVATLLIVLSACGGGRTLQFTSLEPGSEIALVPLDNPDSSGVKQKNPASVTTQVLQKQAIRITATGKAPVYWFAPGDSGRRMDVRVKALPLCQTSDANRNRPVRLLLKAYQNLSSKDFNLARDLATKAAEIDPTLAAPHIITGLVYIAQGKKEDARLAFNKAQALDPEDAEINELLGLTR